MEAETKNNTSEITQITFKLTQDERQIIEESSNALDLNISEFCRIKCLMSENTVLEQRLKILEYEKQIKTLRVNLDFFKNSERTPNHHIVLEVTEEEREVINKMFGDFMVGDNELGDNIIEALIGFYGKLKEEGHDFYIDKISMKEVEDIFYLEEEES